MSSGDDSTVDALDTAFSISHASTFQPQEEFPDILHGSEFLNEEIREPGKCLEPDCDGFCTASMDGEEIKINCLQSASHNTTVPIADYTRCRISFEAVLSYFAESLDMELIDYTEELPRYVESEASDGYRLCLIVSPGDYEDTVETICRTAIEDDRPTLLITPTQDTEIIHEIQSLFAAGHLVTATPIRMFAEPEIVQEAVGAMLSRSQFRRSAVSQQTDPDAHPVVDRLSSNPSYAIAELNQMRMLRASKQLPKGSGTRLEKVSEVAFAQLFATYPDAGGEDDSGSKLPDILFRIPAIPKANQHDEILGIADSKSGSEANFGSEKVDEKHPRYLQRARRDGPESDLHAHVFLVLGFDGHKELDFFDKMDPHYQDKEYMVIVTAEALATMLIARLTHPIENKFLLQKNDFRSVLYPLFHRDWFNKDEELAKMTREVGSNQNKYNREYNSRSDLIVLTREVVIRQLTRYLKKDGAIERELESYFEPMNYRPP